MKVLTPYTSTGNGKELIPNYNRSSTSHFSLRHLLNSFSLQNNTKADYTTILKMTWERHHNITFNLIICHKRGPKSQTSKALSLFFFTKLLLIFFLLKIPYLFIKWTGAGIIRCYYSIPVTLRHEMQDKPAKNKPSQHIVWFHHVDDSHTPPSVIPYPFTAQKEPEMQEGWESKVNITPTMCETELRPNQNNSIKNICLHTPLLWLPPLKVWLYTETKQKIQRTSKWQNKSKI
jgi:hypothetical protein